MKKYSIIISSLLLIAILTGGCKKYLDINKNPNAAAEPPIEGLLANTTNLTGFNVYYISDWTSYYVQYLASPSVSSSTDTYQQIDPSGTWGAIYNVLTDLHDMHKFAEEKGLNAYAGRCQYSYGLQSKYGKQYMGRYALFGSICRSK